MMNLKALFSRLLTKENFEVNKYVGLDVIVNLKLERKIPMKFREPLFHKYLPIKTKLFASYSIYLIRKYF